MQYTERDTRDILLYAVIAIVALAVCSLLWVLFNRIGVPVSTPTSVAVATTQTTTPNADFTPPTSTVTPTQTPTERPTVETQIPPQTTEDPPTGTPTPTSSPTPEPIIGVVRASALNVREAPTDASRIVGGVRQGDEVIILNQARAGYWLEIVTERKRRGWVSASWVDGVDLDEVPIASVDISQQGTGASSTSTVTKIVIEPGTLVEERTISGVIPKYDDEWFVFTENNIETLIVFMYRPNTPGVQFQLFRDELIPDNGLPSGNPEDMDNVGAGSFPHEDRDGDLNTGELLWRGGDLTVGSRYYIWFSNPTGRPIEYCIIPADVYEWICPP